MGSPEHASVSEFEGEISSQSALRSCCPGPQDHLQGEQDSGGKVTLEMPGERPPPFPRTSDDRRFPKSGRAAQLDIFQVQVGTRELEGNAADCQRPHRERQRGPRDAQRRAPRSALDPVPRSPAPPVTHRPRDRCARTPTDTVSTSNCSERVTAVGKLKRSTR